MNLKNKSGITLIALIVTIIVLIIIAGISIASLTSDNGVLRQTNESKVMQIEGTAREQIDLGCSAVRLAIAEASAKDNSYSANENAELIHDVLLNTVIADNAELDKEGWKSGTVNADGTFTITYEGEDYKNACNDPNAKIQYTITLGQKSIEVTDIGTGITGADGKDTDIDITSEFEISSVEVPLNEEVAIHCIAEVPSGYENPYVVFTKENGEKYTVNQYTTNNEKLIFKFTDFYLTQMGETVDIKLYATYNGKEVSVEKTGFTIEGYCKEVYNKTAAQLNFSQEKYNAVKTVIADLLEMGARMQILDEYKVENLVNEGITGQSVFKELTSTDFSKEKLDENTTVEVQGVTWTFKRDNRLEYYFTAENVENIRVELTGQGQTITYDKDDFITSSGMYRINGPWKPLNALDDIYTLVWYENDQAVYRLTFSMKAAVYGYQNFTESHGADYYNSACLVKALYNYVQSLRAYQAFN